MPREHVACPCCGHRGGRIAEPVYEPLDVQPGSAHHRALKALRRKSRTAEQVSAKVHLSPNETASRLLELRRAGLVEYVVDADTGNVVLRLTSRKTPAKVQQITSRGRAVLASF
jgi:hypothetical protein